MKPEEAHTLVGFLKGAFPSMTQEQMEVYESGLLYEDATLASKAILDGIKEWKFAPKYAEIVERIRVERRKATPPVPGAPTEFVREIPFWVKRWLVARFIATPPDRRPFKESYPELEGRLPRGETEWMPEDAHAEEAKTLAHEQFEQMISVLGGGET